MGRKTKSAVLALSVILVVLGAQAAPGTNAPERAESPKPTLQQASVTVPGPGPAEPLVVQAALSANTRGWSHSSGETPAADQAIRPELVDAYTLAVALAPPGCHLSLSLLAAIGQVESGNLAGQRIDAQHRVVPGVLGPVLDGSKYAEIPDTDDGLWDGHRTYDRALGPLQLLPASWRVAGMDADGDGLRDPQNVYDAAGAAMVYLCDGGRDLGTGEGLEEAVLAYNHSRDYLRLVLAWKKVFDAADITGLGLPPAWGAWATPTLLASTTSRAGESTVQLPTSSSSEPGTAAESSRPSTGSSQATTATAATDPTASPTAVPTASDPPATSGKPNTNPGDKPGDEPKPGDKPGDTPGDTPGDKPGDKPGEEQPACPDGTTLTDDPNTTSVCCPTIDPTQPTEPPTPAPAVDPSEAPDQCATEKPTTATPTEVPTP